jgi:hypothetical protein
MFGLDWIKIAVVGGGILASLSAVAAVYHGIQASEAAKIELQQAKLVAAAQHEQDQRSIEALQLRANAAAALAAQNTKLQEALHVVPVTRACLASPAGHAFSQWLHNSSGFPGATNKAAASTVGVPTPASATR